MALQQLITGAVHDLVRQHHSRDPEELALAEGIIVSYKDLGGLKAFFCVVHGERNIVVNREVEPELLPLVLAHELGHAVLHTELAAAQPLLDHSLFHGVASRPEYEANLFAADLLIPEKSLRSLLPRAEDIYQLAADLSVPAPLLLFKLKLLQLGGEDLPLPLPPDSQFLRYL